MTVDLFASLPHYADHLWPVWSELPADRRGSTGAARSGSWWGQYPYRHPPRSRASWAMIAGASDRGAVRGCRLILLEHGAGQTYEGQTNGSYAGGRGWHDADLGLVPGPAALEAWEAHYPDLDVVAVGAPHLDRWHDPQRSSQAVDLDRPAVAVTFHWDCFLVLETSSALKYYRPALDRLVAWAADAGVRLLGHAHPRAAHVLRPLWTELGVPWVPTFGEVLDRAQLLVGDNTSALYEFASTGRPVVALNAPWWRRDVEHGLRFWSHVPGPQVDDRSDLVDVVADTLEHPGASAELRAAATARVYAHTDGQATARAVATILEVLDAEPQGSTPARRPH